MTAVLALLKPLAIIAAVAFFVGFCGYLAFAQPGRAVTSVEARPAAASAPASDDWNLPKHI